MPVESLQDIVKQETERSLEDTDYEILLYIGDSPRPVTQEDIDRLTFPHPSVWRMGQYYGAELITDRQRHGQYVLTQKCAAFLDEQLRAGRLAHIRRHFSRPAGTPLTPAGQHPSIAGSDPVPKPQEEERIAVRELTLAAAESARDSFPPDEEPEIDLSKVQPDPEVARQVAAELQRREAEEARVSGRRGGRAGQGRRPTPPPPETLAEEPA